MVIAAKHSQLLRSHPLCIVDVGARGGVQEHWRQIREHCLFVGFEPEAEEARRLSTHAAANELFLAHALYRHAGTATLHHCADPRCSSLYAPNPDVLDEVYSNPTGYRVVRTESIPVTTLDSLLASNALPNPDFIKLDCQGSELDILQGSQRALASSLIGVECEVEFVPLYQNQPLALHVTEWLRTQGFDLMGLRTEVHRSDIRFGERGGRGYKNAIEFVSAWAGRALPPRGSWSGRSQLIYGDALYMRRPQNYLAWVRAQHAEPLGSILKAVVLASELKLYEYALQLSEAARMDGVINAADEADLTRYVERRSRDPRRLLAAARGATRKLVRRIKSPGYGILPR